MRIKEDLKRAGGARGLAQGALFYEVLDVLGDGRNRGEAEARHNLTIRWGVIMLAHEVGNKIENLLLLFRQLFAHVCYNYRTDG